jgi:nucleoside-diphosphate-sugar epimerase
VAPSPRRQRPTLPVPPPEIARSAAGHVAALNKLLSTPGFGCQAVNLGTGKGTTVLEMVRTFEEATGAKVAYKVRAWGLVCSQPGRGALRNPSRALGARSAAIRRAAARPPLTAAPAGPPATPPNALIPPSSFPLAATPQLVDRRAGDAPAVWAGTELAEKMLGWRAERTLFDMCKSLWAWAQKNPQGYDTPGPDAPPAKPAAAAAAAPAPRGAGEARADAGAQTEPVAAAAE